jgi:NADH:ubiquinone oxidoreductase subunit 6 (subunit J)
MSGADILLLALGAFAIGGAAFVVFGRNLFHNIVAFTAMLLGLAGMFALLGADFLAIALVFVYVGGVVVLLLFGLMLTASEPSAPVAVDSKHSVLGAVAAVALAALLVPVMAVLAAEGKAGAPLAGGSTKALGELLLTQYATAFEIVGLVLLVAAVAAIVIVRRGEAT